jgi:serine/threonine-protein kinase SRK2
MAPEIKLKQVYDGQEVDVFSLGVILFILSQGHFPFQQALKSDKFYTKLITREYEEYWTLVKAKGVSTEFKDLLQRMFSFDPAQRPTLAELERHSWFTKSSDSYLENTRAKLLLDGKTDFLSSV